MILTGPEIRRQVAAGAIEIDPFVPEHVNPASVDLTLGKTVFTYDLSNLHQRERVGLFLGFIPPRWGDAVLDSRVQQTTFSDEIPDAGVTLVPGELYLMHTVERVCSKKFVPVLDGKSSLGRLGVSVHATAGFGDIGFDGQWTLEVTCVLPVRLYAGMRVAQMRFHAVQGEIEQYAGNYAGETARGPVASRSWRQFK